ncbi:hypothetical protein H4R34_002286 [Dimargaris verticillata]|uniref:Uncharacterized protein n=1 Tax=Dimargaris verticillata TaxID=2761393 RepID=A0A9W8B4G6_9FUNG|nr:hypothetical protein H4R34_002286 [Dimargaris verticillata]
MSILKSLEPTTPHFNQHSSSFHTREMDAKERRLSGGSLLESSRLYSMTRDKSHPKSSGLAMAGSLLDPASHPPGPLMTGGLLRSGTVSPHSPPEHSLLQALSHDHPAVGPGFFGGRGHDGLLGGSSAFHRSPLSPSYSTAGTPGASQPTAASFAAASEAMAFQSQPTSPNGLSGFGSDLMSMVRSVPTSRRNSNEFPNILRGLDGLTLDDSHGHVHYGESPQLPAGIAEKLFEDDLDLVIGGGSSALGGGPMGRRTGSRDGSDSLPGLARSDSFPGVMANPSATDQSVWNPGPVSNPGGSGAGHLADALRDDPGHLQARHYMPAHSRVEQFFQANHRSNSTNQLSALGGDLGHSAKHGLGAPGHGMLRTQSQILQDMPTAPYDSPRPNLSRNVSMPRLDQYPFADSMHSLGTHRFNSDFSASLLEAPTAVNGSVYPPAIMTHNLDALTPAGFCRLYQSGFCPNGDHCPFPHVVSAGPTGQGASYNPRFNSRPTPPPISPTGVMHGAGGGFAGPPMPAGPMGTKFTDGRVGASASAYAHNSGTGPHHGTRPGSYNPNGAGARFNQSTRGFHGNGHMAANPRTIASRPLPSSGSRVAPHGIGNTGPPVAPHMNGLTNLPMGHHPTAHAKQPGHHQPHHGGGHHPGHHHHHHPHPRHHATHGGGAKPGNGGHVDHDGSSRFAGVTLESVVGEMYPLSKDQHGCRFLQRKLEDDPEKNFTLIYDEVFPHIHQLMTEPFGNYLCQKLLEYCTKDQRARIVEHVAPELVKISLNMHGTRAVQKMIELLVDDAQISTVVHALKDHVVTLIKDINGNHVIQKCLNRLSGDQNQFIYDSVCASCNEVATHRHGCCVFQRCIDHASEPQKRQLVREVTANALLLVQDPFGNYVVQYVLDLKRQEFSDPLIRQFARDVCRLSVQKFSSNVVEKCIRAAHPSSRRQLIAGLLLSAQLEVLLKDSFANYVIQTALDFAEPDQRALLVEAIRPVLPAIRNTPYGRRIQGKIQRDLQNLSLRGSLSAVPSRAGSPSLNELNNGQPAELHGVPGPDANTPVSAPMPPKPN